MIDFIERFSKIHGTQVNSTATINIVINRHTHIVNICLVLTTNKKLCIALRMRPFWWLQWPFRIFKMLSLL